MDYTEKRYDIGIGLHGDHVGGELDAIRALMEGTVDASVSSGFELGRLEEGWNY